MGSFYSSFRKVDVSLTAKEFAIGALAPTHLSAQIAKKVDNKFKKELIRYVLTFKNLEYYSERKVKIDELGNYLFPILSDSELFNDKSLIEVLSSYTNNNEIKIHNYFDYELYDVSPTEDKKNLGLFCLIIENKNNYVLSIIEKEFCSNNDNKFDIGYHCDVYNGFICKDDCKKIEIFVGDELFEEFNNCKKDNYYQFKLPLFIYLMKDKIYIRISSSSKMDNEKNDDKIKIDFVCTYFQTSFRKDFLEMFLLNHSKNKIFGTNIYYVDNNKIPRLVYDNDDNVLINKILTKNLNIYKSSNNIIDLYSNKKLTQLKTRYIERELVQRTWHPKRFQDWCLSNDEKIDLIY